jgi:hypothetical protein
LLAFQYAVITMIYLVLVGIILRHAHVTTDEGVRVLAIACVGLAIGTILQAQRGPIGSEFLALPVYSAVFLAPSIEAAQGGMALVYGMVAFAGLAEIIFALLLGQLAVIVTPILTGLAIADGRPRARPGRHGAGVGYRRTDDLDNEEQAAFAGLAEFLRHLAADRKEVVTKNGQVVVRLAYGI